MHSALFKAYNRTILCLFSVKKLSLMNVEMIFTKMHSGLIISDMANYIYIYIKIHGLMIHVPIIYCYPRAARWPRSGHTLSIKIFCKNYGSVWRVPSTLTALSSDYNSYCHSNSSYATSLRPIRTG